MPRALTDSGRVELRLRPEDKATLTRAARSEEHTSELQSPALIAYAVFCL